MIFDFDNTFLVHFILFLSFMVLSNKLFFQPFLNIKKQRLNQTDIKEQEIIKLKAKLKTLQDDLNNKINTARTKILSERAKTIAKLHSESEQLKKEADMISVRLLTEADKQIKQEYKETLKKMSHEIDDIAEKFTKQLINSKG